jgi:hypothetical protein
MSMPHPSQIDWQEIEKKMNKPKTTPTHSNGEEWREGYTKIEHPEWGTAFVRRIERSDAIKLLRDWTWDNYDNYNESAYDILEWCIDMLESGIKGWKDWTSEELAEEMNRMNTDADWHYENEEDENGEECPVIFEVYNGVHG